MKLNRQQPQRIDEGPEDCVVPEVRHVRLVKCQRSVARVGKFFFIPQKVLFLIPGTVALFLCGWCWCWLFPCGAFLALQHGTHGKRLEIKLMPADVYRWRALFWFGGASETRSCHASELFRSLRQDVRRGNW